MHLWEIAEIPNLAKISFNKRTITSNDAKTIQMVDSKDQRLKLAFQLALRYADNWNRHFLLEISTKHKNKKPPEKKAVNIRKLKDMWKNVSKLDDDVLLFLHRASDFTGEYSKHQYSEVTAINALFALEMQVTKAYLKLRSTTTGLPKRPEMHKKIRMLHSYGRIKSHQHLLLLLALVHIRNKLAHTEWTKLKELGVQRLQVCIERRHRVWREDTKSMRVVCGPKYSRNPNAYFTTDKRLKHETARLILQKVIDGIVILHKVS